MCFYIFWLSYLLSMFCFLGDWITRKIDIHTLSVHIGLVCFYSESLLCVCVELNSPPEKGIGHTNNNRFSLASLPCLRFMGDTHSCVFVNGGKGEKPFISRRQSLFLCHLAMSYPSLSCWSPIYWWLMASHQEGGWVLARYNFVFILCWYPANLKSHSSRVKRNLTSEISSPKILWFHLYIISSSTSFLSFFLSYTCVWRGDWSLAFVPSPTSALSMLLSCCVCLLSNSYSKLEMSCQTFRKMSVNGIQFDVRRRKRGLSSSFTLGGNNSRKRCRPAFWWLVACGCVVVFGS